ncbi:MAG: hypothetical protein K6F09_03745 [Clostridiales bacterium]|nr:hypothetical protein [Clostridiales bacterium]
MMSQCAENGQTGTFRVFCYNVFGLPKLISGVDRGVKWDTTFNQRSIGRYLNGEPYDVVAVQEDFGYHRLLAAEMTKYKYRTQPHGGIPSGDGTNIFTFEKKMYNEEHIPWNTLYGIVTDGADRFSQKGLTYACIEIADGVYVDFYNIHTDACDDEGSVKARADNFRQLKELISNRKIDRPVIVTGDFNETMSDDFAGMYHFLVNGCDLKDAWTELCNGGDYEDFTSYEDKYGYDTEDKLGVWDSIERFLYKSGGGVEITCDSFDFYDVKNERGESCSDHKAARTTFTYKVTDKTKIKTVDLFETRPNYAREYKRRAEKLFGAVKIAVDNRKEINGYIKEKVFKRNK